MFGTQGLVNRVILEQKDNPITPIGDLSVLRIMEIMFDEQWKELNKQFQFSEDCAITVPHFGRFAVNNSKLRKYVRDGVRQIRKLRARIKELELNPKFEHEKSMTVILERDLVLKVRVAWKQLDSLRNLWISKSNYYKRKNLHKNDTI